MNYEVGDLIVQQSFGGPRTVLVIAKYNEIKNGFPGFDAVKIPYDPNDWLNGAWGYDHQVTKVIRPDRLTLVTKYGLTQDKINALVKGEGVL